MTWVRIDDGFAQHPKVVAAGPLAMAMQVAALCYCNRNLTDGFIPRSVARTLLDVSAKKIIISLLTSGLWREIDGGYQIHDYEDYQPTKAQIQAEREIAKRRFAMNANPQLAKAVKARDGDQCRYCGVVVNWRDRKGVGGGTYDHVVPMKDGGEESIDNIVVACRACNSKKGARTPDQAGMRLISVNNLPVIQSNSRQPVPNPVPVPTQEATSTDNPDGSVVDSDPVLGSLSTAFLKRWPGRLNVTIRADLEEWAEKLPENFEDVLLYAFSECDRAGGDWRYVDRILERLEAEGWSWSENGHYETAEEMADRVVAEVNGEAD
jgi:hypothetical protein